MDKQLHSLINNKRVAIIGPAEYVCKELDEGHGKFIDSFDVVIRLNDMFHVPEDLQKFYGSKYDIISSSFWTRTNDDYKDKNVAWDKTRYCNEEDYNNLNEGTILLECFARNEFSIIYDKFKETIDKKKLIYGNLSQNLFSHIFNKLRTIYPIDKTPTTGFSTIGMVLAMAPKEVYITGITAYQETPYKCHFDGYNRINDENKYYWPTNGYNGKTFNDASGIEHINTHHNFKGEAIIMKRLIECYVVKVDKYMDELFRSI